MFKKTFIRRYICSYSTAIFLAFLVRIVWIFLIPQISNAPDEVSHWIAVKYLSEHFRQPSSEEIFSYQVGAHVLQIQMSYYHMVITNFLLSRFFVHEVILIYASRIVNALLSIVVVINCKYFFEKIFKDRWLANLLSLVIAFHPQYVFVSSYINNDIFACWITTLSIIALAEFVVKPAPLKPAELSKSQKLLQLSPFILSLSIFCGVYAKSSALLIYIATAIVIASLGVQKTIKYLAQRKRNINPKIFFLYNKRIIFYKLILVIAPLVLSYLLYYLYTLKISLPGISPSDIFSGSFMAQIIVYPTLPKGIYSTIFSSHSLTSYLIKYTEMGYWQLLLEGFWGIFDNMSMKMNSFWYYFYLPYSLMFFYGTLKVFDRSSKSSYFTLLDYILCLVIVLMCVGSLSFSYKIDLQPQGRHFLPILLVFYYFMTKGFQSLGRYYFTKVSILLLLVMSVVCTLLYVPINLFRVYYAY